MLLCFYSVVHAMFFHNIVGLSLSIFYSRESPCYFGGILKRPMDYWKLTFSTVQIRETSIVPFAPIGLVNSNLEDINELFRQEKML